jgi:hypothetical protein
VKTQRHSIAVIGRKKYLQWDSQVAMAAGQLGHRVLHLQTNGRPPEIQCGRGVLKALPFCKRRTAERISDGWHARWMARRLSGATPDIIILAGAMFITEPYYLMLNRFKVEHPGTIIVGWVGDRFNDTTAHRFRQSVLDLACYTDSSFAGAFVQGLTTRYLPLAASPIFFSAIDYPEKSIECIFVGSSSPHREAMLAAVRTPVTVYGNGWRRLKKNAPANIAVHDRKISPERTRRLYEQAKICLNFRNEKSVVHGVNQRSFEPFLGSCLVVHEQVADLASCFEIGREIVSFSTSEELNSHLAALRADHAVRRQVAEAGRRRVLSEHTFTHRLHDLISELTG